MYDPGTLYVDPILTGFSVGYQDQTLWGDRIMPITPVNTQSGKYLVFDRSAWVIFPSRREPGTVANEVSGAKWSYDTFFTREHSLQAPVLDEERQQLNSLGGLAQPLAGGADVDIDPERDATELVTRSILLEHEKKVADTVRNTANYAVGNTVTLAGAQQWDDYTGGAASTSDPVSALRAGIRKIKALTGRRPNTLAIPSDGIEYLENHPRVIDRFKNFALTDPEAFRKLTGFDGTILPVESVYNAADNIDAAESITSLWGKDVWLGIVDPTPGQKTKTFGKTFAQTYPDGTTRPTDRWREIQRKADLVRVSMKYDLKIVSNVAGYLIKNAFSATAF
jgi:hypothetical protein